MKAIFVILTAVALPFTSARAVPDSATLALAMTTDFAKRTKAARTLRIVAPTRA